MSKRVSLVVALACALVVGVGTASAVVPACGATVTGIVTLTGDMTNCPGDGLVVGASNTTINLNGHTIDGVGLSSQAGVRVTGKTLVYVNGPGTITGFGTGVAFQGGGLFVRSATITGNTTGVSSIGSGIRVTGNSIFANGTGVSLFLCDYCLITGNVMSANTGSAVSASSSTRIYIANNSIFGNGAPGAVVLANTVTNQIQQNSISGNVGGGLVLLNADNNQITQNTVTGSVLGDGIFLDVFSSTSLLKNNRTNSNSDDGIDVDNPLTWIIWNIANFNGDYGIEAVPGVRDGGLNQAGGNGNRAQCLFVHCS